MLNDWHVVEWVCRCLSSYIPVSWTARSFIQWFKAMNLSMAASECNDILLMLICPAMGRFFHTGFLFPTICVMIGYFDHYCCLEINPSLLQCFCTPRRSCIMKLCDTSRRTHVLLLFLSCKLQLPSWILLQSSHAGLLLHLSEQHVQSASTRSSEWLSS